MNLPPPPPPPPPPPLAHLPPPPHGSNPPAAAAVAAAGPYPPIPPPHGIPPGYPPPPPAMAMMMPGHPPPPPMHGAPGGYAPGMMAMQHHHPRTHPPPPPPSSSAAATSTALVLLTNVPACLHHPRAVRDWIVGCGNARSVLLAPPPSRPRRKKKQAGDDNKDNGADANNQVDDDEDSDESDDDEEDRDLVPPSRLASVTGLVTMSHPEAAVRFVAAFKSFRTKLLLENDNGKDDNVEAASEAKFSAHLVPLSNPEIPLPPLAAGLDPSVVDALGEQLLKSYRSWRAGDRDHLLLGYWGTASQQQHSDPHGSSNDPASSSGGGSLPQKRARNYLDDDDDEDDDDLPSNEHLQAPEVRQAVQAFRRKIERLNTTKSSRRKQVVLDRVSAMLPRVREQVRRELEREPANPPGPPGAALAAPPPPPPAHVPGHPSLAPPMPMPARGVSNLPAWMTAAAQQQSQQQAPPDATSTTVTSALDAASLRAFVSSQIQKYLGEDEPTLCDFVVQKVCEVVAALAGPSSSGQLEEAIRTALLPDLKDVLDEDSDDFIRAVVAQVRTML